MSSPRPCREPDPGEGAGPTWHAAILCARVANPGRPSGVAPASLRGVGWPATIARQREEGRELVDHAIYTELALGTVRPELRHRLLELCRDAIDRRGADGIILGCTELPLALSQTDFAVPVIDTARVHVEAILDRALA